MKRLFLVLLAVGIIALGSLEWANEAWDQPGPPAPHGAQTVVLIPPHTGVHAIARQLEVAGVLGHALIFEFDLRLKGLADKVKAGEYAIPAQASMARIAAILVSGKGVQHKLTAAEGLTSEMIWKLVKADPVLVGDAGAVPEEGTLLPETYLFTRGTSRAQLLARMKKAESDFLAKQWAARDPGVPLASPREAVILASVVEKETALPEERRHIASVFLNRLKAGMKLQSDPTIIYGLTKGYPLGRGILESEIEAPTPYNTYVIAGLPQGPIANPGKDSILAVLHPEQTDDLYFVATGQGGHVFSDNMAQHLKNVSAWRAVERRQQGLPPEPVPVKKEAPMKKPARRHRQH
jgi:UPF0755 protein